MADYVEFDSILVQKIAGGANTFTALLGTQLHRLADDLAGKDRHGDPQGWRLIDRRLQAMRKAGKIVYNAKSGWSVANG